MITSNPSGNIWFRNGVVITGVTGSSYSATTSGSYTVEATNVTGCISGNSSPIVVTVNPLPTVGAISGSGVICAGSTTQLTSTTSGGTWSSSNNGILTIDGSGNIQGVSAGNATISYTVSNASGCAVTVTKNITVTALPAKPSITAASSTSFCAPGSVALNSSAASGNQWFKDAVAIANANGLSYTATTTGIYTVVNTENGCSSAISDPIAVSANATPAPPLVKVVGSNIACEGETVKLITSTQSKKLWYRTPSCSGIDQAVEGRRAKAGCPWYSEA